MPDQPSLPLLQRVQVATLAALSRLDPRADRITPLFSRMHARLYRRAAGKRWASWFGTPVLLLETVGRRSGAVRATPLVYARQEDRLVVSAVNAGSHRMPAWWLNLQATPDAYVTVDGQRRPVRARRAEGAEADELRLAHLRASPVAARYRQFTDRDFPVVVLEPR